MYVTYTFDLAATAGSGNVFIGHFVASAAQNLHVVNVQVDVLETTTTANHVTCELHRLSAVGTSSVVVAGVKRDATAPKAIGSSAARTYSVDPTSSGVIDGANIPAGPASSPWVAQYPLGHVKIAPSGSAAVVVNRNGTTGTPACKARVTVFEEG